MKTREELITETLVQLADTLVSDYDPNEMFYLLVDSCRSVLEIDQAGLMLKDPAGGLQVVAATSEATHIVEVLQIQNDEGPCLDAVESGKPVETGPLTDPAAAERWPQLVETALRAGFHAITALPMRLRQDVLGGLNLFFTEHRPPEARDISVAQAFADIAAIAILHNRATEDSRVVVDQLQRALDSRIVIEQAKGRVAQHANVDVDTAFTMIRQHARNNNLRLSDVAADLISGTVHPSLISASEPPQSRVSSEDRPPRDGAAQDPGSRSTREAPTMEHASATTDLAADAAPFLTTDTRLDHDLLTVRVGGELDLATAPLLEEALSQYKGKYQSVVYELEELTFIDCSGLRGLLAPIDGGHLDGRIIINTASRAVWRLLELLEMEHIIHS